MLNEQEQSFIDHWKIKREREGRILYQWLAGLPVGLLFAVPVFLILFSGRFWYKRADMVANSQLSPLVLIIAVVLIASFVAVVHKRHQWEMKEQQYKQLKAKSGK